MMLAQAGVTIAIPNWNDEVLLPARSRRPCGRWRCSGNGESPPRWWPFDDCSRDGSSDAAAPARSAVLQGRVPLLAFAANAGLGGQPEPRAISTPDTVPILPRRGQRADPREPPCFLETLEQTKAAVAYGNLLTRSVAADGASAY